MIILTARIPKLKFPQATAAATAAVCGFLVFSLVRTPYEPVLAQVETISSQGQRLEYLENWGWEVVETPLSVETLLIPETLDETYQTYLDLQASQGFPSLQDYCGETVERYTYAISNYPSGAVGMQVNLLIHNQSVIGGEVLSTEINGILHGLAMPDDGF